MADPKRPEPESDDRTGVQGGERDVSTDVQPPADTPSEATSEGGMRGEEARDGRSGGMAGEG